MIAGVVIGTFGLLRVAHEGVFEARILRSIYAWFALIVASAILALVYDPMWGMLTISGLIGLMNARKYGRRR